jgi:SAM-dependent methyltransferase
MRVLDVGSGAGDVAFLAAELVGPSGEITGVDLSPTAVAAAKTGAKRRLQTNVSPYLGDPAYMVFEQPFDAIVGRYVLMFSPDPVSMLKSIARHLRPGGVIVFHEPDWTGARSHPPSPTYENCHKCIVRTFLKVGTNPYMGLTLYAAFLAAGLPAPTMGLQALIGGDASELDGLDLLADLAITMAPVMEQEGVTTIAELAPDTLYRRMRAEAIASGSVAVGRSEIGAWTQVS